MSDIVDDTPRLACPHCGCSNALRTVEILEALASVTFALGESAAPDYTGESELLWDTQHWPENGSIVCRNCDQVDLRYEQLIPEHPATRDPARPIPAAVVRPAKGARP